MKYIYLLILLIILLVLIFPPFDRDAKAYIKKVESTGRDLTQAQKKAVNTYFVGMKKAGIWDKVIKHKN